MPRMKANRLPNMLAFNGSSDFLTLPIVPAVTGFNLAFWVIRRNFTNNARIFDCQDSGPANGFTIVEITGGSIQFVTRNGGSATGSLNSVKNVNGRLDHYAVTFDGTEMKVYENGTLIGTDSSSVMSAFLATVNIGRRTSGGSFWNGKLGELVFHSTPTPWTTQEISDLYYNGAIPSGASYWLFDGNVLDGSGNGNNGTLTGGTYVYGAKRKVAIRDEENILSYSGNGQYTEVVSTTMTAFNGSSTICFFVKFNNPNQSGDRAIIDCQSGDNNAGGWEIYKISGTEKLKGYVGDYTGRDVFLNAGYPLTAGRWHHVAITKTGTTQTVYVNGVVVEKKTNCTAGTRNPSAATNIRFGGNRVGGAECACAMGNIQIYNVALTGEQVQGVYYDGNTYSGLIHHYKHNDGSGSTLTDSVGSANGTITGATWSTKGPFKLRSVATGRKDLIYSSDSNHKTVIDTFAADGFTKSGSGTTGTWSVDSSDTYDGRNTLKLVTAGAGLGSRDYAIKTISIPLDFNEHMVFEIVAKVNDINRIYRFYLDLYVSGNYYEIQLEATGNKSGNNNEYDLYRGTLHGWMNNQPIMPKINSIRIQVSDSGAPVTVNFAEFSVYRMAKKAYICWTNDDGTKSGYDFYHTVLKPLNIKGTLFPSKENIISGQGGNVNYMNHANVLQLESDGFEIGIHGESGTTTKTATTISFDSATKEIRDSGNAFVSLGFKAGQFINVAGSANNNSKYTVVNVTAGAITVIETIVTESAGASVKVECVGYAMFSDTGELDTYIQGQKDYLKNTVGVASDLSSCALPNGEFGKNSNSFPSSVTRGMFSVVRTTKQNTEPLIHVDLFRIGAGRGLYLNNTWTEQQVKDALSGLLLTGGIGVIVSHSLTSSATDSYNFNLTNATNIANVIGDFIAKGRLTPITIKEIPTITEFVRTPVP